MNITDYIKRLHIVPSLFQLNIGKVRQHVFKEIIEKADMDDSDILKVPEENLVSFVYFLLKQQAESKAENDKVLFDRPTNINANCMKVVLSAHAKNFTDAEEHLKRLNELKEDRFLVVEAEAELAFAYSKLGLEFNMVAISKLSEVVNEQPTQYEWKYRLALILRRCQHPNIRILLPSKLNYTDNFVRCKELFEDIVTNCSNDTLKALSLVEIAVLFTEPNIQDVDFRKLGIDEGKIRDIIIKYLDTAMEYDRNNVRVLQETGRMLRKIKEFKAARKILEEVVRRQEKDVAYHHLALTIGKLEGTTPEVIEYLEKASRSGLNIIATIDLGKAYLQLNPPNYEKALESFNRLDGSEYVMMRQKYYNLCKCYKAMIYQTTDRSARNKAYRKSLEMNKKVIIFGILSFIKSTPKEDFVKCKFIELFPGRMRRIYDYTNQKDNFLQQVHLFEGKSNYTYLDRLQCLIKGGSLEAINYEIKKDLDEGKYEGCLEMVLFLLITDLDGIDQVVISTMMKILQVAVETGRKTLASKCLLWPMEYFYLVDNYSLGHFRILADSDGGKEAEMIETWLVDLGMIVVRNDEDISSFSDRREALIESLQANVAVLCIIKGNNSSLLDEYPINMLPSDKPYLIPVIVDDSKVPNILRGYQPLTLPPKDDDREKASWLKSVGEKIFHC